MLNVTQLSTTNETLSLEFNEIALSARADNDGFRVSSNTDWSWSSNETWLTSSEAVNKSGNDCFFVFSVTANTFATPRVGIITFTTASGEVITTLTVTQEGTILNLSESEITLGSAG